MRSWFSRGRRAQDVKQCTGEACDECTRCWVRAEVAFGCSIKRVHVAPIMLQSEVRLEGEISMSLAFNSSSDGGEVSDEWG
ncbi:hypothetical protein V6N13_124965 [Hibiscus sabdariffa]